MYITGEHNNNNELLFALRVHWTVPLRLMPDMPSAETRPITTITSVPTSVVNSHTVSNMVPIKGPEFNISAKDVEGLVLEIKENLRVSAGTLKSLPYSHLSRKSSRASPYRIPSALGRNTCSCNICDHNCPRRIKRKQQQDLDHLEDPYELLQRLLRDGSLVNEAVRRLQIGYSPKKRYFYESDEDASPVLRLCTQEN